MAVEARHERTAARSRGYRLTAAESARDGMRRVLVGRLDHALEQLREATAGDPVTPVHEARKDLKKARAAIRLIGDRLDPERYRLEMGRLREAGQALARLRDADARIETLDALRGRQGAQRTDVAAAIEREIAAARAGLPTPAAVGEATGAAAKLIGLSVPFARSLDPPQDGWALLAGGRERGYRRGRRRLGAVRADRGDEVVHEWRKRVKDLAYQLRLLRESWPPIVGGLAGQAARLAELLGDHHDLTVLAGELGSTPDRGREAASVLELAERRQGELLDEAIPLGAALYADKPTAFERRMHAYWRAWR
jgi:CHAD domain-containing protein